MSEDARLERIERHVDEVRQAIIVLARIEERTITLLKKSEAYEAKQVALTERVNALEKNVGGNGQMLRFAERVFWIVVTAGVAFAFTSMGG